MRAEDRQEQETQAGCSGRARDCKCPANPPPRGFGHQETSINFAMP